MLKIETLPEDTRVELNRVTSINPTELSKDDAAFLRARKLYLRPEQVAVFAEVLNVVKKTPEPKKATKVEADPFEK